MNENLIINMFTVYSNVGVFSSFLLMLSGSFSSACCWCMSGSTWGEIKGKVMALWQVWPIPSGSFDCVARILSCSLWTLWSIFYAHSSIYINFFFSSIPSPLICPLLPIWLNDAQWCNVTDSFVSYLGDPSPPQQSKRSHAMLCTTTKKKVKMKRKEILRTAFN